MALKKNKENSGTPEHHIRAADVLFCALVILALLAMISHSPLDWDVLRGGVSAPLRNWIGSAGAWFSLTVLLACGIAGYILVVVLFLRAVRRLLPQPGSFRNFITGTLLMMAGAMLLLAINPGTFVQITHNLGLGDKTQPLKALSGGLIGQFFAGPAVETLSAGCLRNFLGTVGTAVIGWFLLGAGAIISYISDWHRLLRGVAPVAEATGSGVASALQNWLDKRAARAQAAAEAAAEEDEASEDDETIESIEEKEILPPSPADTVKKRKKSGEQQSRLEQMIAAISGNPTPAAADSGELPFINDDAADEPVVPAQPAPKFSPAAAAAAAPAVLETPDVGKHVVQQGRKLEGEYGEFVLPPITMLAQGTNIIGESSDAIELAKSKIQQTLDDFSIAGHVSGHVSGPRVTRYEITLDPGISVKKVEQIQDNIRMVLAATSIRVLAPIPGRSVVGVEVSNSKPEAVFMRSVMESDEWKYGKAEIPIALGKNVSGKPVILDLAKAPHMLVAGATGTGKSVCSNSLITSLLFRFKPDELRLIMVDPKIVEFDAYKTLPHLLTPIINDSAKVPIALRWAANEMDRRYHVLAKVGVKKLSEFNNRPKPVEPEIDHEGNPIPEKMPLLVIILDELADLMMTEAKKDVETNITRIAQKGRAAGIHIIVATQRPSTNIITGVIKANLPTRLCFQVRSLIDSRVVLDTPGAEKLLGMGDMLVMTSSSMEIERVQGAWVKDDDIKTVVKFVSDQWPQRFNDTVLAESDDSDEEIDEDLERIDDEDRADIAPVIQKYMRPGDDDTIRRALEVVVLDRKASTSYLQRRLKIGYNRAAEIIELFEERGIVGPPSGSGNKRDILIFDGIDIG